MDGSSLLRLRFYYISLLYLRVGLLYDIAFKSSLRKLRLGEFLIKSRNMGNVNGFHALAYRYLEDIALVEACTRINALMDDRIFVSLVIL